VVTVPTLTEWLDGLPPRLTPLVAVPIAAYLWTLPLQLHVFGVVSPYCILINVLTSLLITIISIGGMGSAVLALIHPVLGGATAWILQWPTELFLHIAATVDRLPANGFAIGTISKISVILIYGMYGLIAWQTPFLKRLQKPLQKQWWIAAVISLGLVFIPAYTAAQAFQMTVLSTAENGVMIWRDQGKVGLMNLGSEADVRFAVLPFLKQQGINHVNWAIAPTLTTTEIKQWQQFLQSLPIHLFYAIPASHRIPAKADRISKEKQAKEKANFATAYRQLQQTITAKKGMALTLSHQQKIAGGDLAIAPISLQPVILKFQTHSQTWLYLSRLPYQSLPAADVLWWTGRSTNGRSLTPELLAQVNPQVVITANPLPDATQTWLKTHKTQVFQTAEGAVQWTKSGFRSVGESP
jgi:competence protein ComEC